MARAALAWAAVQGSIYQSLAVAVEPAPLMRRDPSFQASTAVLANSTNAAADEELDAETLKIVWDSLHPINGAQAQVSAQMNRAAPKSHALTQVCLLTNEFSDSRNYLSQPKFHQQVKAGMNMAKDRRLIIAGMWRQIGSVAVKRIWASLNALGSFFRDYQMIMLENDSHDDTKAAIGEVCGQEARAWCFTLAGLGNVPLHAGVKDRVKGLTALRQSLLLKIREFDPANSFDYVMMVDADIFAEGNGGFDVAGALSALPLTTAQQKNADAICAYQVQGRSQNYYDTFAHRGPECKFQNLAGEDSCPAQSCGGGMVLYTMAALHESACNYNYVNEQTCEHVPFNFCLASHNHGRIFLYKPWSVAMLASGKRSDWNCMAL